VRGKAGGKVMRENEPVLLVLSVCDGEIILEKGEILSEKRQGGEMFTTRQAFHRPNRILYNGELQRRDSR
jgi:hypothetical protein